MSVYEKIYKKFDFSTTQLEIIKIIGQSKTILEIGPSTGYMTKVFLRNACIVDVVENDRKSFSKLPGGIRKAFKSSIEDKSIMNKIGKDYDFIIMADVLEHLINPENFLKKLHKKISGKTTLLISVPNIASWVMRKQLFFKGDFEYQESGLLDKTHLHFYTVNALPKILSGCGWKVLKITGTITRVPLESLIGKIPFLRKFIVEKYKNLSYYHFLVIARK